MACSGGDADHVVAEHAVAWIRRNLRAGAWIGAVADAAFFLARAGLLDGHACTLHWTSQPAFTEAFPEIELRRDLYVIDRKRFTSAGGVGSLDMMLDIIATDCGSELAAGVAEWFVHSPLRSSVDRKLMPLRLRTGIQDELVLSAIAIMEEAVEDRLRDDRAGRPPRRLRRPAGARLPRRRRHLPGAYYRRLRLRRAADLLAHSTLPVRDVALACGFSDMSSFARAFREQEGHLAPRRAQAIGTPLSSWRAPQGRGHPGAARTRPLDGHVASLLATDGSFGGNLHIIRGFPHEPPPAGRRIPGRTGRRA